MDFNTILNSPAFVIHIPELSPERTEFFKKNITEAGFKNLIIFNGVNAKNYEEVTKITSNYYNIKFEKSLASGQIGCFLSHLKLYNHIIRNNIQIATIFEDDVYFHPQWHQLAHNYYNNTPKNYDILFIGNQIEKCSIDNNTVPLINTESTFCTHAYIITYEGAKKLVNLLINWDYYTKENHEYIGHPLTGLFAIDIIIKNIQDRINKKTLKPLLKWYCWNGCKFICKDNKLPLTGFKCRNTGLVFQSDNFKTTVYIIDSVSVFKNNENIYIKIPINSKINIITFILDNKDITNTIKNFIENYTLNEENILLINSLTLYNFLDIQNYNYIKIIYNFI
jgi:glycosyl transferase family 25